MARKAVFLWVRAIGVLRTVRCTKKAVQLRQRSAQFASQDHRYRRTRYRVLLQATDVLPQAVSNALVAGLISNPFAKDHHFEGVLREVHLPVRKHARRHRVQ